MLAEACDATSTPEGCVALPRLEACEAGEALQGGETPPAAEEGRDLDEAEPADGGSGSDGTGPRLRREKTLSGVLMRLFGGGLPEADAAAAARSKLAGCLEEAEPAEIGSSGNPDAARRAKTLSCLGEAEEALPPPSIAAATSVGARAQRLPPRRRSTSRGCFCR